MFNQMHIVIVQSGLDYKSFFFLSCRSACGVKDTWYENIVHASDFDKRKLIKMWP